MEDRAGQGSGPSVPAAALGDRSVFLDRRRPRQKENEILRNPAQNLSASFLLCPPEP
jgi:hypothetical protein